TEPGNLIFDPTCGSGTTAFAAEMYGRRWITCYASRVATNIARKCMLSAIYPHFKTQNGFISGGFVYESVSRTSLRSLAYGQEPERVSLVDRPLVDTTDIRVTGPLEIKGRYTIEDWKGYVVSERGIDDPAKL